MNNKVVITGATGFIGKKIVRKLIERGDEVTIFTRSIANARTIFPDASHFVEWDFKSTGWAKYLEGKDAVINLAGENLMAKRWSSKHKINIRDSRILSTRALVRAISNLKNKPQLFISISAVGFYGHSEFEVDETSHIGNGFLAEVVGDWENESVQIKNMGVRRVIIRAGVVLDKNEGALSKMILPFKLFIGGSLGSGNQWMSWIHIDDLVNLFLFALDNKKVEGIINGVSPNPVRMDEFAKTIGSVLNRPSLLRVPEFVLKLILGEASVTVLEGAKVMPKRASNFGYKFSYKNLQDTFRQIL